MLIPATDADVIEMGKLAVLASSPVGMGFLHYDDSLTKDGIALTPSAHGLYIDYYQGRMVKFRAWKRENVWEFPDNISSEYESWIHTYPSYRALFESAQAINAVDPVGEGDNGLSTRASASGSSHVPAADRRSD